MTPVQVLVNTPATLRVTFYADGAPADDGTVTVTVTRADGSVLVAGAATTHPATGVYTYALAAQAELDRLTATWTGAASTEQTVAEVVGAHLFTLAEARSFDGGALASTTTYPNDDLLAARGRITDDFQAVCGVAFIPRYERETLDGDGTATLPLGQVKAQRVIAASIGGTALSPAELADLHVSPSGLLVRKTLGVWTAGVGNVTVAYAHGFARVPPAITRAALKVAKHQLVRSDTPDRQTSYTTDAGTTVFLSTAGRTTGRGDVQHFGIPEVDSVLNRPEYHHRTSAVA